MSFSERQGRGDVMDFRQRNNLAFGALLEFFSGLSLNGNAIELHISNGNNVLFAWQNGGEEQAAISCKIEDTERGPGLNICGEVIYDSKDILSNLQSAKSRIENPSTTCMKALFPKKKE